MQNSCTRTQDCPNCCASCPLVTTCLKQSAAANKACKAPWWPVYIFYTLLAFCVIRYGCTALSESMHLRPDYDANIYHIIGRGWMQGVLPYAELSDIKGPLHFLFCGIGSMPDSSSFLGTSIFLALITGIGLLYACKCAALFVGRTAALGIAGLLFVYTLYYSAHPSVIVLSLQYISFYWVLLSLVRSIHIGYGRLFTIGLFIGCVAMLKFNLVFFWVALLPILISNKGKALKNCAVVVGGTAAAMLPMLGYLWHADLLQSCWQEYICTAIQYGNVGIQQSALVQQNWRLLEQVVPDHLYLTLPPIVNTLAGAALLLPWIVLPYAAKLKHARRYTFYMTATFLLCVVSIFGGRHHFLHYYFTLQPFILLSLVVYVLLARQWHLPHYVRRFCTRLALLCPIATAVAAAALPYYVNAFKPGKGLHESRQATQAIVKKLSGQSFLCTEASPCLYLYRLSNTTPPIRHFFPQLTPTGYSLYHNELLSCIRSSAAPRYLVCTAAGAAYTEELIRQASAPYHQVPLSPPEFPTYPAGADYAPFCLFERH